MKQRYSCLDCAAIVKELKADLVNLRLQNIYDIDSRNFLFKFSDRTNLLIESGIRIHLTNFVRDKLLQPGQFVTKLRKHLRNRRLTTVDQLGFDRAISLKFASNDVASSYEIIVELFAAGNIILLDGAQKILSLLRVVKNAKDQCYDIGSIYDLNRFKCTKIPSLCISEILESSSISSLRETYAHDVQNQKDYDKKSSFKIPRKSGTIRFVLNRQLQSLGSSIVNLLLELASIDGNSDLNILTSASDLKRLEETCALLNKTFEKIFEGTNKASILCLEGNNQTCKKVHEFSDRIFDTYEPFDLQEILPDKKADILVLDSANNAYDIFYANLEAQRIDRRVSQQKLEAQRRLENISIQHEEKINQLMQQQNANMRKASLIQENSEDVGTVIKIVKQMMEQNMDWKDIENLIEEEKKLNNPIAKMILLPINFSKSKLTINLPSNDIERPCNEQPVAVEIDMRLSAFANANKYFDNRKSAARKEEKTKKASEEAISSQRKKVEERLRKGLKADKSLLKRSREPLWFEKYYWVQFSRSILFLCGKDRQQTYQLLKNHATNNDFVVTAELENAAVVLVKKVDSDVQINPVCLEQAGMFSLSFSRAWESKIVTSAYYALWKDVELNVEAEKYADLPVLILKGEKSFLPPSRLSFGIGLIGVFIDEKKIDSLTHKESSEQTADDELNPARSNHLDKTDEYTSDYSIQNLTPITDDNIKSQFEFPIPVFAPYSLLKDFAFKAKITPGTLKKGKAAKAVKSLWLRKAKGTRVETLISDLLDQEIANSIPISRLSIAGAPNTLNKRDRKDQNR